MRKPLLTFLAVLLAATPALAQELRAATQIPSSGSVTSEASRKIVSSLRALIADFGAEGFAKENALVRGAQQRFSSETLRFILPAELTSTSLSPTRPSACSTATTSRLRS